MPTRAGSGAALVSLILLTGLAIYVSTVVWPREVTDVLTYRHAADLLRQGGVGLYDTGRLPAGVWPYLYPPAFAALFAPILLLGREAGNILWAMIVAGGVGVSFWALRRLAGLDTARMVLLGLCLALPTGWLLIMGQVDGLVVALLAVALLAHEDERPAVAGVLIGLAAAIKVIPVFALLPFLVLRRWRVVMTALAAAAAFSLLPFLWLVPDVGVWEGVRRLVGLHAEFVQQVVLVGFGQATAEEWMSLPWNASLPGTAMRLLDAPALGALAMWLLVLVGTWLTHRTRDVALGVALVVPAGALGSFVFSSHNVFLFALPLAVAFSLTATALVFATFLLVLWLNPVLGTLGYLLAWGKCAVDGVRTRGERTEAGVGP